MEQYKEPQNIRSFIIICIGQLISILGTGLTNFAVGIWVFQTTGSVTKFALMMLAISVPGILVSPFAGALVDRWDRKLTMIGGDALAGLCSLGMMLLLYAQSLRVWQVAIIVAIASLGGLFHSLAFTASISLLIPKEHLSRASGFMDIGPAIARILSPLLAGALLAVMPIYQVVLIDVVTFLLAVLSISAIRIPRPPVSEEAKTGKGSIWSEARLGWDYIKTRPGLLRLLGFFAFINIVLSLTDVILTPLWLGMAPIQVVGRIASGVSFGMLVGSIVISIWGGPRKKIHGVLGFAALLGVFLALMGLRPSVALITISGFGMLFCVPLIYGCNQTIWMMKTPHDLQGRVSSIRTMIGWSTPVIAYLAAGPLTDQVFEPLLAPRGSWANTVGRVFGVGPGRGIGVLLFILGVLTLIAAGASYLNPRIRLIEKEIADAFGETGEQEGTGEETNFPEKAAAAVYQ